MRGERAYGQVEFPGKAQLMGFPLGVPGDVELVPGGQLALQVPGDHALRANLDLHT